MLFSETMRVVTDDFTNFLTRPSKDEWIDHFAGQGNELYDASAAASREAAANEWVEDGLGPDAFLESRDHWNEVVVRMFKDQHKEEVGSVVTDDP